MICLSLEKKKMKNLSLLLNTHFHIYTHTQNLVEQFHFFRNIFHRNLWECEREGDLLDITASSKCSDFTKWLRNDGITIVLLEKSQFFSLWSERNSRPLISESDMAKVNQFYWVNQITFNPLSSYNSHKLACLLPTSFPSRLERKTQRRAISRSLVLFFFHGWKKTHVSNT